MEESSTLKLIIEKGPREGETLEYPSTKVVKIGRVVRGNTIGIKDAGISTKHISIQFDHELHRWTLSDLDSSNGTNLNGQSLEPHVPSVLKDGDCIKIGELTSIIVKIGVEATIQPEKNPRRKGKAGTRAATAVKGDGDLGQNDVEEPVQQRNLRSRAKKAAGSKNEVENLSSRRMLRSCKKEIPEDLDLDERKEAELVVPIEGKRTREARRGRNLPKDADIVVPEDGKRTLRGKKVLPVEPVENAQSKVNESAQDLVAEKSVLMEEGKEAMDDENSLKGSSEVQDQDHADKGKEVTEELEHKQDGCEYPVQDIGSENMDLEKMTLGQFFDCLEVQLTKEIYEKSEKILADLKEKALKCHEFRFQRKENSKGL